MNDDWFCGGFGRSLPPPPASVNSSHLMLALQLLLRKMTPDDKRAFARWLRDAAAVVEQSASEPPKEGR